MNIWEKDNWDTEHLMENFTGFCCTYDVELTEILFLFSDIPVMADDQLQKFDPVKQKHLLNKTALDFMKIIEQRNRERVEKLRRVKQRNKYTGIGLGALVLSIYGYSLFAVKQETFLDDFDPPELVPKSENK